MKGKEFLIFLFFLALAGIIWLLTTLNETYEQEVRIPVRYVNIPQSVVMTSSETDTLRVTVRDKGISLITYLYNHNLTPIDIDFKRYARKDGTGIVGSSDLLKMVGKMLPASAVPLSVKPENVIFYYNNGEKKDVPVVFVGQMTPDPLYFITDTVFTTKTITVYASTELLDTLTCVYTEPMTHKDFRNSVSVNSRLQKIKGAKMVPERVTVTFNTDVKTEVTISEIPVIGENMPANMELRTFPAKVAVTFVTGMKNYQDIKPADFQVVADYDEFSTDPSTSCNIYLRKKPDGIHRVRLDRTQVDFLLDTIDASSIHHVP
ncbi:MAG: YbbR-like domain-containing protein [Prevotella sp.]|nr:YbbR-like domain-containing protein [Prevotella sp.]